jgi:hypothetical protein
MAQTDMAQTDTAQTDTAQLPEHVWERCLDCVLFTFDSRNMNQVLLLGVSPAWRTHVLRSLAACIEALVSNSPARRTIRLPTTTLGHEGGLLLESAAALGCMDGLELMLLSHSKVFARRPWARWLLPATARGQTS